MSREGLVVFVCCVLVAFYVGMIYGQAIMPKCPTLRPAVAVRDASCLTTGQIKKLIYQTAKECRK